jgi:hypothetical protein
MPCSAIWGRTLKVDTSRSPPQAFSFAGPEGKEGSFFENLLVGAGSSWFGEGLEDGEIPEWVGISVKTFMATL